MPEVSVLISTRDRYAPLRRAMESVLHQAYGDYELLILDDHSSRYNVKERLERELAEGTLVGPAGGITCWRSEEPLGIAGARNFLMARARGRLFFVLDDDAVLSHPDCIGRAVEVLGAHPTVGILATCIANHGQDGQDLRVPFGRRALGRDRELVNRMQKVAYFLGGCHVLRAEVYRRCGPYPADLVFGTEELDLAYRAIAAGYELLYVPDIRADHYPEPSVIDDREGGELYYSLRNKLSLAHRHLPWVYAVPYGLFWTARCALWGLRTGQLGDVLRGFTAGVAQCKKQERRPLGPVARRYLRRHHGRLWY